MKRIVTNITKYKKPLDRSRQQDSNTRTEIIDSRNEQNMIDGSNIIKWHKINVSLIPRTDDHESQGSPKKFGSGRQGCRSIRTSRK
jgi:hypothetical protein